MVNPTRFQQRPHRPVLPFPPLFSPTFSLPLILHHTQDISLASSLSISLCFPYPCKRRRREKEGEKEMIITLVFFATIFLLGFFNSLLLSLSPTKKTMAWLSSLFVAVSPLPAPSTNKALPCQQPRPKTTNAAELRRVFSTFDHNDDGLITRQELQDSLENLGIFVSDADLDSMVARLDTNGDGALDLQEFCVLTESVNVSGRQDGGAGSDRDGEGLGWEQVGEDEELKEAFDVFDVNGDGFITVEELGSVLSSMGLKRRASRTQLAEMIGTVDADGDGRVSLAEFQQMMKTGAAGVSPIA